MLTFSEQDFKTDVPFKQLEFVYSLSKNIKNLVFSVEESEYGWQALKKPSIFEYIALFVIQKAKASANTVLPNKHSYANYCQLMQEFNSHNNLKLTKAYSIIINYITSGKLTVCFSKEIITKWYNDILKLSQVYRKIITFIGGDRKTFLNYAVFLLGHSSIPERVYKHPSIADIQNWITEIGVRNSNYGVPFLGGQTLFVSGRVSLGTRFRLDQLIKQLSRAELFAWKICVDCSYCLGFKSLPADNRNLENFLEELLKVPGAEQVNGDLETLANLYKTLIINHFPFVAAKQINNIVNELKKIAIIFDACKTQLGKPPHFGVIRGLVVGDSVSAGMRAKYSFLLRVHEEFAFRISI